MPKCPSYQIHEPGKITPERKAILDIMEDSKGLAYEKYEGGCSAVQVLSPTCIDRIKMLWKLPTNQEI